MDKQNGQIQIIDADSPAPMIEYFVRDQDGEAALSPHWYTPGQRQNTLRKVTRQAIVADLVAKGWNYTQIAEALGVSQPTISQDMQQMVTRLTEFAGRTVEEWLTSQLLILERQIQETIVDTQDDDPKVRNMARRSLALLLKQQDRLLKLSVRRVEVEVKQHVELIGMDLTGLLPDNPSPELLQRLGLVSGE